jgi:hypothetical protein
MIVIWSERHEQAVRYVAEAVDLMLSQLGDLP